MHKQKKYFSAIFVGRNDNYGGDFKSRLQNCVSNLSGQLNRFKIPSEIIFVNYNYLPEPSILDFIEWPKSTALVDIRIINVPNDIHQEFVKSNNVKDVPVIEYFAKNIGIRRANGKFLLCMNPDILISDKIIEFISKRKLRDNIFYRANRIDYVDQNGRKKLLNIHLKGKTYPLSHFSSFKLIRLNLKNRIIGLYYRNTIHFEKLFNFLKIPVIYDNAEYFYHCKVSGDFMMMSKNSFNQLNGYHEMAQVALHIDSLFVIQAATSGLKEYIFKAPIFHREHERRYSSERKNEIENNAYISFQKEAQEMLKTKKNKIYNSESWGLKNIDLHEYNC